MGYSKAVREGHATGGLGDLIIEALDDLQAGKIRKWYDAFSSLKESRKAVGKLWHCTDIVGHIIGTVVQDEFRLEKRPCTLAQVARVLFADLKVSGLAR